MKLGLRRSKPPNADIVVVSGLPRSGTSLMMRMLEAGGLPVLADGVRTADTDNPRGYYELEQVKKLSSGDAAFLEEAQGKAVKVVATLLSYLPDSYTYRVIFMRRAMSEVLASQRAMLVNRGEDPEKMPDQEMGRIFAEHLERLRPFLREHPGLRVLDVEHNDLVTGSDPVLIEHINDFVGGGLDTTAMAATVDPSLYRQRADRRS